MPGPTASPPLNHWLDEVGRRGVLGARISLWKLWQLAGRPDGISPVQVTWAGGEPPTLGREADGDLTGDSFDAMRYLDLIDPGHHDEMARHRNLFRPFLDDLRVLYEMRCPPPGPGGLVRTIEPSDN